MNSRNFAGRCLTSCASPLEEGEVWISRSRERSRFPCRVALVAATNPCPCGWFGDPQRACRCGEALRQRYWSRLSGPLLDRIDLQVVMRRLEADDLLGPASLSPTAPTTAPISRPGTATVALLVAEARQRMVERNPGGCANSALSSADLQQHSRISTEGMELWRQAIRQRRLSARAAERLLRVARTIADLDNAEAVDPAHWPKPSPTARLTSGKRATHDRRILEANLIQAKQHLSLGRSAASVGHSLANPAHEAIKNSHQKRASRRFSQSR